MKYYRTIKSKPNFNNPIPSIYIKEKYQFTSGL